ncbi:MAG: MFS transporter, partial [Clostridiales bacterium]|nr:MFS transporter [Clostridiales bacterium]
YMVIFGAGIGVTMPITNMNVQNAAPVEQLASATGAAQFFRSIGSTVASAVYGTIMASTMAKGLLSLDLTGVPEAVQASLRKPQISTDRDALGALVTQEPATPTEAVQNALTGAKNVLNSGISSVFICCAGIAVAGIAASLFFKGAPMQIVRLGEQKDAASEVKTAE